MNLRSPTGAVLLVHVPTKPILGSPSPSQGGEAASFHATVSPPLGCDIISGTLWNSGPSCAGEAVPGSMTTCLVHPHCAHLALPSRGARQMSDAPLLSFGEGRGTAEGRTDTSVLLRGRGAGGWGKPPPSIPSHG